MGSAKVSYLKTSEAVFQFLLANRADLFINSEIEIYFIINQQHIKGQVQVLPAVFGTVELHLGISKLSQHAPARDKINAAIKAMKADGTIEIILARYGCLP